MQHESVLGQPCHLTGKRETPRGERLPTAGCCWDGDGGSGGASAYMRAPDRRRRPCAVRTRVRRVDRLCGTRARIGLRKPSGGRRAAAPHLLQPACLARKSEFCLSPSRAALRAHASYRARPASSTLLLTHDAMRMIHVLLALGIAVAATRSLPAQVLREAQPSGRATSAVTLVDPSPRAEATLEPAVIMLDYGQPHLRGRALHTDSLVPYDKPWRTGANAATTLSTGVDLLLGGVAVPRGTYILFTLPTRTGWTLVLQRDGGQRPGMFDPSHDVARIALRRRPLEAPIESLTMWLIPSTAPGAPRGELRIMWGHTELSTDWSVQ